MDKQRRLEWYRLGNTGEPPPSFKAHLVLSRLLAAAERSGTSGAVAQAAEGCIGHTPPAPLPPRPRPPAPPHAHTYRHAHFTLAGGRHGMTQTASCQAVAAQPQPPETPGPPAPKRRKVAALEAALPSVAAAAVNPVHGTWKSTALASVFTDPSEAAPFLHPGLCRRLTSSGCVQSAYADYRMLTFRVSRADLIAHCPTGHTENEMADRVFSSKPQPNPYRSSRPVFKNAVPGSTGPE